MSFFFGLPYLFSNGYPKKCDLLPYYHNSERKPMPISENWNENEKAKAEETRLMCCGKQEPMDGGDGFGGWRFITAVGWNLTEMTKFGAYAAFGSSLRLYVGTRSAFPLRLILFSFPPLYSHQRLSFLHVSSYLPRVVFSCFVLCPHGIIDFKIRFASPTRFRLTIALVMSTFSNKINRFGYS